MFSFKRQRRDRLRAIPLPQSWLKIIERNVPFYRCLPEADRRELQGHVQVFLDEKHFEGCRGLQVILNRHQTLIYSPTESCLLSKEVQHKYLMYESELVLLMRSGLPLLRKRACSCSTVTQTTTRQ